MTNTFLMNKHCFPCKGGIPCLTDTEIKNLFIQLNTYWQINHLGHLYKKCEFKNFNEAMEFANKIAVIAEQEQHHPELTIGWGECGVEIWTHKMNGLTESDFILAAKIEALYE